MSDFTRIRLRRSSSEEWTTSDPILAMGEAGYETDTNKLKIGNGSGVWTSLDYLRVDPSSIPFPDSILSIYDAMDARLSINLTNNDPLRIVGSGGTNIIYDNYTNTVTINSIGTGDPKVNKLDIYDALGYIPQISGSYSLLNHNHSIANISGLQNILDSKQISGSYSLSDHSHTLKIGDGLNNRISYQINDRLDLVGSGYATVLYDEYTNKIIIYASGNSGVISFNDRVGNVKLNFIDVTGAIGYVPQPIGVCSLSGHKHYTTDILDIENLFPYYTPGSSSSSGQPGQICWDNSYLYLCVSSDSWHRIPHSSW